MEIQASGTSSPQDPAVLRREIVAPAVALLKTAKGYAAGCDKDGYRANKAALEMHLDKVERVANDKNLPVDLRADALGALAGLSGILAANEMSPSLGKKSYFAATSRAELVEGRDANAVITQALVPIGFTRLGGLKRKMVEMGLGVKTEDELRKAANRLSRYPSDLRAQVTLDLVMRAIGGHKAPDELVRTQVAKRLEDFTRQGRGAEITKNRAELEDWLTPDQCIADAA